MCTKISTDPKLEDEEYRLEGMVPDYKNQHCISRHIVERASGVPACALAASHKLAAGGMHDACLATGSSRGVGQADPLIRWPTNDGMPAATL